MATARQTLDELDEEERRRISGGGMADEPEAAMELPEADLGRQTGDAYGQDEGPEFRPAELAGEPPPQPEPEPRSDPSDWGELPKPHMAIAQALTGKKSEDDEMRRIASKRYVPSSNVSDDAIAKAKADRKQKTQWNDLSRAMTAWAFRKPFEPTPPEGEAADLTQQRGREESNFEKDKSLQLALAKALRGEKSTTPGSLTEYQKYQIEQDKSKAAADKSQADAEAAQLDIDRKMLGEQLGIDASKLSRKAIDELLQLRHAKATERVADSNLAIARAGEGRKQSEHESLKEGIPFAGGRLRYTGTGEPRERDVEKAQDIAGGFNAAIEGMNDLEGSLNAFATNPSADTKRAVDSKVRVVSSALNAAVGGGAMSEAEAIAMANALGANVTSLQGLEAVLQHLLGDDPAAAKTLLTRLRSVRESAKATALGKLKAYHFGGDVVVPDGGQEEESRVIDGKTYRKKGQRWVTDG